MTVSALVAFDYRTAFDLAPVGLVLSRQRLMIDCNRELLAMFRAEREQLIGRSFEILYPTADEFERTGLRIAAQPHAAGIWAFEDLSAKRALKYELTPREREIAALLIEGLTSKGVGRRLGISPRTVDVYRARLMRKTGAATTPELVKRLLSGQN